MNEMANIFHKSQWYLASMFGIPYASASFQLPIPWGTAYDFLLAAP